MSDHIILLGAHYLLPAVFEITHFWACAIPSVMRGDTAIATVGFWPNLQLLLHLVLLAWNVALVIIGRGLLPSSCILLTAIFGLVLTFILPASPRRATNPATPTTTTYAAAWMVSRTSLLFHTLTESVAALAVLVVLLLAPLHTARHSVQMYFLPRTLLIYSRAD
jgi:hypothetical protein